MSCIGTSKELYDTDESVKLPSQLIDTFSDILGVSDLRPIWWTGKDPFPTPRDCIYFILPFYKIFRLFNWIPKLNKTLNTNHFFFNPHPLYTSSKIILHLNMYPWNPETPRTSITCTSHPRDLPISSLSGNERFPRTDEPPGTSGIPCWESGVWEGSGGHYWRTKGPDVDGGLEFNGRIIERRELQTPTSEGHTTTVPVNTTN